jgi:O-antigen/teichoic acid export membrane protein
MSVKLLLTKVQLHKKIILNSLWVILDKTIKLIGGLFVGIWFARYLGPAKFGIWNYVLSLIALVIPFINLGLNNILLTDLVRKENKNEILFTAFFLKFIAGSAICLLIIAFAPLLAADSVTRYLLIILSVQCVFQFSDIFDVYYQSRTESKKTVVAKSIAYILINILKVIAIMNGMSLYVFALLTVLETICGLGILLYIYFKTTGTLFGSFKVNWPLAKDLIIRSSPLIIAEIMIVLYTRLDQVMLRNMVGDVELGRYSAVVRLSELWYFLGMAINVSFYPRLVKLHEEPDKQNFRNGLQKLLNLLSGIAIAIAISVTFLSNFITDLLYGSKYPDIGNILAVHIWTGVFVFLGVAGGNFFLVNNLQKYFVFRTAIGLFINVVLNFILIPRYGGMGAAVATLAAQIFASFLSNLFNGETRFLFFMQLKSLFIHFKPSLKNYI